MVDITVTPANVVPAANATIERRYNAGATILAGQSVYLDATTNLWQLADANLSQTAAAASGVATHGASANQPLAVQTGGDINPGATVAVGSIYVVSATAGGIAPSADGVTGWFTTILGIATTAANLRLGVQVSGVAKP